MEGQELSPGSEGKLGHDWWLEVCWEEGRRRESDPEKRPQRSRRRPPPFL